MTTISSWFERNGAYVGLAAAWTAMLGSLYFSEAAGYVPCRLCWFQRVLMYPLAGILAVGILRRDRGLPYYALPFSILGIGVSSYHYLLQKTNLFTESASCQEGVPCTTMWINWFGFATIPFLALIGFLIITVTMLVTLQSEEVTVLSVSGAGRPWLPVAGIIGALLLVFGILAADNDASAAADGASISLTPLAADAAIAMVPDFTPGPPDPEGASLYATVCAPCHGAAGQGVAILGSPLAGSVYLVDHNDAEILAFIRNGRMTNDPANVTGHIMPGSGGRPDLSDEEMLSIIRHLRSLPPPAR